MKEAPLWEMTALKPSLLWNEGWPILHDVGSHTLCELRTYYKVTDLHKLGVQVMMVSDVHSSHTNMVAADKPIFVSSCLHH